MPGHGRPFHARGYFLLGIKDELDESGTRYYIFGQFLVSLGELYVNQIIDISFAPWSN